MEIPRPKAEVSSPLFEDDVIAEVMSIYENDAEVREAARVTPGNDEFSFMRKAETEEAETEEKKEAASPDPAPEAAGEQTETHRINGKIKKRVSSKALEKIIAETVYRAIREEIGNQSASAASSPAQSSTAPLYAESMYEGKYALKEKDGDNIYPVGSCLRVGRDPKYADLIPEGNTTISGKHAELTERGGVLLVKDIGTSGQGSQNGTYVNGNRIPPNISVEVMPGDLIRFSNAEYFVLTKEQEET